MGDLRTQLQAALGDAYTLERELSGGGMSRVFVASDATLRRSIVVKVLPPELAADVSVARFQREVSLAARLQHPHIVPLLGTGDAGGLPYYTMPFVDGETLRDRLTRGGELPVGEAVRLLREIATALAYAHEKGVVHRDVKPENVLLTGGIALVTDFGVAKALIDATTVGTGALTTPGVAVGTPAYMSPEQVSADPGIDHRADLYSFGVVAYELLSGQPPFAGRTTQALLAAHVVETPESLAARRPALPVGLATLVMRCLEKRQADRPQNAAEIVRALDALTTPLPTAVPSAALIPNAKRRAVRARLLGVVVLTAVVAGGMWFEIARRRASGSTSASSVGASRLFVVPFDNGTGDARFDHIGRIAAIRLAFVVDQNGAIDVVPAKIGFGALADTTGGKADRLQRLADATRAGLVVSGSVLLRGDSLLLQAQVIDVQTGKSVVPLEPVTASATDPIAGIDALGDRLLGGLGLRREITVLPQGYRAPMYLALRAFAEGFERFSVRGDLIGSRPFFERAIEIDSTYTQAYQLLVRVFINAGEFARADSMLKRVDRLPVGLTETERLLRDYARAELDGNLAGRLQSAQQLAARDSSPVALLLLGITAGCLIKPELTVRAFESADGAWSLVGGVGAGSVKGGLALGYHYAGKYESELQTLLAAERTFAFNQLTWRGQRLRAYAGLRDAAAAIAAADSVLREATDSTGAAATQVTLGAQEFRTHGDSVTAARLVAMARAWYRQNPGRASRPARQFSEGVAALMSGMADSAAAHFAAVARDTSRIDAAGYLALAYVALGRRAGARAIADSLGALRRPWLFGTNTFWRAAILGALDDRPLAVRLLKESIAEGQCLGESHSDVALDSLRGYPPFAALVEPQN